MSEALVTSRRSFLKLFGATAAVLALPMRAEVLAAVTPTPAPIAASLKPGVLHVFDPAFGGWHALGGVKDFSLESQVMDYFSTFHGVSRHSHRLVTGPPVAEVKLFECDTERLMKLQRVSEEARFAVTLPRWSLEFEGYLDRAWFKSEEWHLGNIRSDVRIETTGKATFREIGGDQ